ncbi:MAG TPA: C39 family peptidase [Candidatus Moranbacteria bacterium]|nr:C39 family peptidase [Candidatus Moranbacteria bacterium]
MTKFFKYYFPVLILAGFVLCFSLNLFSRNSKIQNNAEIKIQNDTETVIQKNAEKIQNNIKEPVNIEEKVPDKIFISVPFASQAPFKIWDALHEEACEEASGIMLAYYLSGKKLTPAIAEQEIQNLVKFENKKFGDYKDTTARQTADMISEFYSLDKIGKKLKVVYDFPKDDLKKYLAQGFPIIIPAAGRKLGNPNFTAPGPLYHNLVLVGYNNDTIITNDPGTRKGEGYKYNIDILYNAIHDFPGKPENIEQGRKAMIVVE